MNDQFVMTPAETETVRKYLALRRKQVSDAIAGTKNPSPSQVELLSSLTRETQYLDSVTGGDTE